MGPPALVEDVINEVAVLDVVVKAVFDVGQRRRAGCSVTMEFCALTSLTTITGDGDVPHFMEEIGNSALELVDVLFLLVVVVVVVIALNFLVVLLCRFLLLHAVVVVIFDEFAVLNLLGNVVVDALVELASLTVVPVVVVFLLNVVVPFFSVEVVVKDVAVNHFSKRTLLEEFDADDVEFDGLLPIACLMLSTMLSLTSSESILLMLGFAVEDVVFEVFVFPILLSSFLLSSSMLETYLFLMF